MWTATIANMMYPDPDNAQPTPKSTGGEGNSISLLQLLYWVALIASYKVMVGYFTKCQWAWH
jgi:hypothetical protein